MQSMRKAIVSIIIATSALQCIRARAINTNSKLARVNEGVYAIKTMLKLNVEDRATLSSVMETVMWAQDSTSSNAANTTAVRHSEMLRGAIWNQMITAALNWAKGLLSVEAVQPHLLHTKLTLANNIDKYYYGLRQYKAVSGILYCNWIHMVICQERDNSANSTLHYILAHSECENLSSTTPQELDCFF